MKEKIAIFPNFIFETLVSTFLDKDKFEVVRLDPSKKGLADRYGQEVFGEWCFPLKIMVAMYEEAVDKQGVKKIIGINFNICRTPLILGDIKRWIKKDFEYYPIEMNDLAPSGKYLRNIYDQLKKCAPGFGFLSFASRARLALKRVGFAGNMRNYYRKMLPLVNNPQLFQTSYHDFCKKMIDADNMKDSQQVYDDFLKKGEEMKIRDKPKYRFLISGDILIIGTKFPLMNLDLELAKHGVEMINPGISASAYHLKYSKYAKRAKKIFSEVFSTKHHKSIANEFHIIEMATLQQIFAGLDQNPDGIIYLKPMMCGPCENLSYILRKENYFGFPAVELSYDEHSGVNGLLTRLEAFINVVAEQKMK